MMSAVALIAAMAAGLGAAQPATATQERTGVVTMRGQPLTLLGPELKVGQKTPDFEVVDKDFKPVRLSDFAGKVVVVSAVPSLDTPVCSLETKRFNDEAVKFPKDVVMLTISMDLPFAQKRFCAAEKVDRIQVLSDCVKRDFGNQYGVLIKELGLLSRSVFIVGKDGTLRYEQLVPEVTNEPDYDAVLAAIKKAAGSE